MSLTIQHVNADATFLITLNLPLPSLASAAEVSPSAFHILVDPWLHSDAPVFHPKFSNQLHTVVPAVTSLAELSPTPNIIVVSQGKSDHCHEGTLKEFEWSAHPETRLHACPDAASAIRAWKWFPQSQLSVIKKGVAARVEVPNPRSPELPAWVELEYIPAKWLWEMPGLHSAIGIKYFFSEAPSSSLSSSPTTKVISALFTPHGIPISALRPWLKRLPGKRPQLALLLHPFTHVHSYMGGDISRGFPAGMGVCKVVDVGAWVSTHDEKKIIQGFVAGQINEKKWGRQKVEEDLLAAGVEGVAAIDLGVSEQLTIDDGVVVDV
ncbi:hypothetical protein Q9L58_001634 [Maublancomyces gigas]|uniref:Metallo-beta-lactamase domain-containing protein n=1 Tax=Discina gigas TaxID=1032678 RepID=A0ABR3GU09_9PEZI